MVARLLDTASSLAVETLTQTGARGGLEASALGCKLPAVVMRLGKTLGGSMTVMLPPAGMGEAAAKESVAVLPMAPGKRSLAAIAKLTLEICRTGAAAEGTGAGAAVVLGGVTILPAPWAWMTVASRSTVKHIATGNNPAGTILFYAALKVCDHNSK